MTIIGDESRFAIEYELDANRGGDWLFGRAAFWIDGRRVGDAETGTSLRDFLFSIERLRSERGRRTSPRFANKPTQEVVDLLDSVLFGSGNPAFDTIANEEQWAKHILKPEVDVFDHWKIYLVETAQNARLMYKHRENPAREVVLCAGECDGVLDEACEKLGALLKSH